MEKKKDFQYKVIMGDADKIARDLKDAEEKRQLDHSRSTNVTGRS